MANRIRKRERFPIGEWACEIKDKRNVLLQANESIQNIQHEIDVAKNSDENLKGKVNELKRKVRETL